MTQPASSARGQRGREPLPQHVILFVSIVVCAAGAAALRERAIGETEMTAADRSAARGDWADCVAHARAAADAAVMGSPWPEQARRRLDAVGRDAATRGDRDIALLAFGALRTSVLATQAPAALPWRLVADEGLVRVAASSPEGVSAPESARAMRAALKDEGMPATVSLAALAVSTLALLAGLARLAGDWQNPRARLAKGLVAASIVSYAAALWLS